MAKNPYNLSVVVPLYNEERGFQNLVQRLNGVIAEMRHYGIEVEVVLVDDGSHDNTPLLIQLQARSAPNYTGVLLSRNFGHQLAVSAGLTYCRGTEAIFIIDGDLQDPPELLGEFYSYLSKGYDVVYGIRKNRKESFVKRLAYTSFYKILNKIASINIPLDSGDFSLISRRVADIIIKMPEESRFLRGMRSWVGFNQVGVEYDRDSRYAGESKYSFRKLWKLAKDGIYNFSEVPISMMRRAGFLAIAFSIVYFSYILYKKLIYNTVPEGFTTIIFMILLFAGLQFIFLGILGEYVLRIFFQVKERPKFIVKEHLNYDEKKIKLENGKEKETGKAFN